MYNAIAFVLLGFIAFVAADADLPLDQPFPGHFTYYEGNGRGACGQPIAADSENLVAISCEYFTTSNPNEDPVCVGYCVRVEHKGKSITVPIKDQCCGCGRDHMDLSLPAFRELEDQIVGDAYGATFTFVRC